MLKFELTLEETNTILSSLVKQPYDSVANLINKIQQQAQPQLQAAKEVTKPAEDKEA